MPLSQQLRKHSLELELSKLDEIEEIFHSSMKEKNHASAAVIMRVKEMRADLLGYRAAIRVDATQIVQAEQPNTTERIQKVLDELVTLPKPEEAGHSKKSDRLH